MISRRRTLVKRFALAAALLVASGYVLGFRIVRVLREQACPPAHVAQPVGVMGGIWRCLPVGVTPPPGDQTWWNTLPIAYRERSVGVYLANLRVRVFTWDENSGERFVGFDVDPAS